jgi:hypothetical protein
MRISLHFSGFLLAMMLAWGQAPPATPAKPSAAPKPATGASSAAPVAASSADPVVLTIGTEKITKSQFEQIFEQIVA